MPKLPDFLTDHPSLVGIIRFPKCIHNVTTVDIPVVRHDEQGHYDTVIQPVSMATQIWCEDRVSNAYSIPKANFTDFYPYTYYVLTDGEVEPLIMHPQYMPSSLTIWGRYAIGHEVVERYFPSEYKGSTNGNIYNITNNNQMLLPTATNTGMAYLQANSTAIGQQRKNQELSNVLNAVSSVASVLSARTPTERGMGALGGVNNLVSGINEIKNIDARNKDALLTPSSISSMGTPSTRNKFNTDSVRLVRYTVSDKVIQKMNAFWERYGNKYNAYATINMRTYKGYIKFINPDLDCQIDNIYVNKIIEILERGVYVE